LNERKLKLYYFTQQTLQAKAKREVREWE